MNLIQARNRLLEIMSPFALHLYTFKVESVVGYDVSGKNLGATSDPAKGGNWQPDMIHYQVMVEVGADLYKYPCSNENHYTQWRFLADGTDLDNVLALIEKQALAVVPVWQKDLDLDAELRSHIGQRFITSKEEHFYVKKKDRAKLYEERRVDIAVGLYGTVVDHKPGFLKLEFDEVYDAEDQLHSMWISQHSVNSYYSRPVKFGFEGPEQRIADPYIRFE